jgi:tRNA A37 threonylcarbamoyladenosine dehydratase
MNNPLYERTSLLCNNQGIENLKNAHVLVVGLGGVGGYVVECLVRSGIGNLTLVDGDTINETNCNRQLISLQNNIGNYKADEWVKRCYQINPNGNFKAINQFVRNEDILKLLSTNYDYCIDAIDEVPAKLDLISTCIEKKIPIISSMGAGGRLISGEVTTCDISKTYGCPLAKAVRSNLKKRNITKGVTAVFSPVTNPIKRVPGTPVGSFAPVVAMFGCRLAEYVLNKIIKQNCII